MHISDQRTNDCSQWFEGKIVSYISIINMVYKKIFEILSNFNFAFTNESGQNFNLSIIAAFMLLTDATNF